MHVFFQHQPHLIGISITTNPCYVGLFISLVRPITDVSPTADGTADDNMINTHPVYLAFVAVVLILIIIVVVYFFLTRKKRGELVPLPS